MSAQDRSKPTEKTELDIGLAEKATSCKSVEPNVVDLKEGAVESLDQAEVFLRQHNFSQSYLSELLQDEASMQTLRRRVDFSLMPLLCGTYLLQYIDKQSLSYSAVFDLFTSTKTTQTEYSWLVSIFYFGYLFFEWPASYLGQHWPTGTVVSCFVLVWGAILMITAACHNFTGLAICRFLLGCCESAITPIFMMIVGQWYMRREQPSRAGLFYCFNGVGSTVGGILFYGVGQADNFPVWRAIFLLCGGVTIVWGVVLLKLLPNSIVAAKRFTPEEKAMLIARSQTNRTGIYNPIIKVSQIKETFTDLQVWILFFFVLLNETINGGFANFGKLIVKGVAGGDALLTTAYGIPSGGFQVFFVLSGPYIAGRFKNIRTYIMALYMIPTVVGTSLVWRLPRDNTRALLGGYYLMGSYVASLVLALQLPATNVAGYTKRVTATAFVFLAYCAGNIIGPHAFLAEEAPVYATGCKVTISCACGQVFLAFCLRALLIYRNNKRDREQNGVLEPGREEMVEDKTDFENPRFRYSY